MDLVKHVYDILEPIAIPCLWQLRPVDFPSVTYQFYNEKGAIFGNGEEIATECYCQIDIWSKENYYDIAKQVKRIMNKNRFIRVDEEDKFESDTQIYHKVINFHYIFEREMEER